MDKTSALINLDLYTTGDIDMLRWLPETAEYALSAIEDRDRLKAEAVDLRQSRGHWKHEHDKLDVKLTALHKTNKGFLKRIDNLEEENRDLKEDRENLKEALVNMRTPPEMKHPPPDRSVDAEELAKWLLIRFTPNDNPDYQKNIREAASRIRVLARVEERAEYLFHKKPTACGAETRAAQRQMAHEGEILLKIIRGEGWDEPSDEEITRDLRRIANGESIIMKCDYKELSRKAADRLEQLGKGV